jgi:glutathione S-transferase
MSYLAVKYDTEFMFHFEDVLEACTCEQWLAWQHGSLAPTQGQANAYYRFLPERHAFSTQRFVAELERYYTVLDTHLEAREYVAGPGQAGKYSIADIAIWPSVDAMAVAGLELANYSHVERWWARIGEREAVKRGMRVPSGEDFAFGVESMRRFEREDREGWDGRERPLVEALERARKESS